MELAALGTVLCICRPQHGGELAGWSQAVRASACSGLDSDGLREQLVFFDRDGDCCWRLCLLPDSDFMAWEDIAAGLPQAVASPPAESIAERLWRSLAGRPGEAWQAFPLRLHAISDARGGSLAASPARLSPLGEAMARGIARAERAGYAGGSPGSRGRGCPEPAPAPVFPRHGADNVISLTRSSHGVRA